VSVTKRSGPERIARGPEETFDPYLSLRFSDEKTVVFPHRTATLARETRRRSACAHKPDRHASAPDRCASKASQHTAKEANSHYGQFEGDQRDHRAYRIGNALIATE